MKALVYHGPGDKRWEEVPDAQVVEPTDVVVQVDTTTICGTDLHILLGDVPAVTPGRILGHEAVGHVVEVGAAVQAFRPGDRVLVPAISSCGTCTYCRAQLPSHCQRLGGIGWVFGHLVDGTQAEYVRVPFGDSSLVAAPPELTDEQLVFLADIFPTGFEMGVKNGGVKPGDVVAVIGVGPVGLAAVATAQLYGPSKVIAIGRSQPRIDTALQLGATHGFSTNDPDWRDQVMAETDGLGVDVSIEAVGVPDTLADAFAVVRPGGRVANAGVHGRSFTLPIHDLWIQNLTFTTGLVNGTSVPVLLRMIEAGRLHPEQMGTHRFALDDMLSAYDVFEHASEHKCLKTVITRA